MGSCAQPPPEFVDNLPTPHHGLAVGTRESPPFRIRMSECEVFRRGLMQSISKGFEGMHSPHNMTAAEPRHQAGHHQGLCR